MISYTATYSPDDNKLRLYASTRLPDDVYARVKAAGFGWAPKQELFVAPMWTPEREDLLLELAGEIDDEDTSLVDRAEERADRFDGYSERRAVDAQRTQDAVAAIADNIPLGQPILVGHHSERRARRDAEKIRNGMSKALKLWDTSTYWERRAKGAIRHAKYKERVDVRHRRIKKLESEQRKQERRRKDADVLLRAWTVVHDADRSFKRKDGQASTFKDRALHLASAGYALTGYGLWSDLDKDAITPEAAQQSRIVDLGVVIARCDRWLSHLTNRLAYERAMLDDAGGLPADRFDIEIGGQVKLDRGEWAVVTRVNRKDGRICSVRTTARYVGLRNIEEVTDYRAPQGDDQVRTLAATTLPKLCNYPGPGIREVTMAFWKRAFTDCKATRVLKADGTHDAHRVRTMMFQGCEVAQVFITDAKRVDAPAPQADETPELPRAQLPDLPAPRPPREPSVAKVAADKLRTAIKAGVQVVAAPQLFPTPDPVAAQLVAGLGVRNGDRVLEPSAGTGAILKALFRATTHLALHDVVAVEINRDLAAALEATWNADVKAADFLTLFRDDLGGRFDRIVGNPPFADGADIEHALHMIHLLAPGGRLRVIVGAGPKQRHKFVNLLAPRGGRWEDLPADSFASSGTNVRAAIITYNAPAEGCPFGNHPDACTHPDCRRDAEARAAS